MTSPLNAWSPSRASAKALLALVAVACAPPATEPVVDGGVDEGPARYVVEPLVEIRGGVHGLALDGERVYFSDTFGPITRDVYVVDDNVERTLIRSEQPAGLHIESQIFVADVSESLVRAYNKETFDLEESFVATQPWNVTRDADGALVVVTFNGLVQELTAAGPLTLFSGLDFPFDIIANDDGTFWVSEQGELGLGRVTRRARDGQVLDELARPLDNPEGLAIRGAHLFVCDTGADEIVQFDLETLEVVEVFAVEIPILIRTSPSGLVANLAAGQLVALRRETQGEL